MKSFMNVFHSEGMKLRKSNIWLLIFVSPLLASLLGLLEVNRDAELNAWPLLWTIMASIHALLFLPLLTGVFSAFVCRYEHNGGGWKQLLALPVSRSGLYMAKFLHVVLLLALAQLLFTAGLIAVGFLNGYEMNIVPWDEFARRACSGWFATLPLAALQLFISTAWASFAAPLAINVMLTLPNMLVVNSEKYGPWYPWSQPARSMLLISDNNYGAFNMPMETLLFIIAGSFIVFLSAGLMYFSRKEI